MWAPGFAWQSGGAYKPLFRGGGLVTAPEAEPAQCEEAVAGAIRSNDADGVLIVAAQLDPDTDGILGYAGCGLRSRRSWPDSGARPWCTPGRSAIPRSWRTSSATLSAGRTPTPAAPSATA